MLSLHTGYDTAYLTDAVGNGTAATDYYTAAAGEPPGYWQGAGARALGLEGQVDAEVMRRLYHEDVGPDGQVLARRQRRAKYPAAGGSLYERIEAEVAAQVARLGRFCTPEEEREIRLRERAKFRTVTPFYDYTFSAPKSVSVLWASLLAAAAEAEAAGDEAEAERLAERAAQVRGAVKRANDRMMAGAEREAAYVRTGHHSATSGEYRDAEGFIVSSFEQSDSRDGMPQLHVHNAIANRARRLDGADDKWRALDGQPLFRERLGFAALADRFLAQELELLGYRTVLREDGTALEVGGVSDEAADAFSTRAKELRDRARELAARPTSGSTATLRASRRGTGSGSRPLSRRAPRRTTTRRLPGSGYRRGPGKQSGAAPGSWPRFTKRRRRTRRSTRRASCRAGRSGGASSARPSPRCRRRIRRGRAASSFLSSATHCPRCPLMSTRRRTSTGSPTRRCPAGPRA